MARIALVNCSDPPTSHFSSRLRPLLNALLTCGHTLDISGIEALGNSHSSSQEISRHWSAPKRASLLTETLNSPDIDIALDLSGGDLANEILPFLSREEISRTKVLYVGYSDNSVIANALVSCGNKALLWNPTAGLIRGFSLLDRALSGAYVRPQLTLSRCDEESLQTHSSASLAYTKPPSIMTQHSSHYAFLQGYSPEVSTSSKTLRWVSSLPWVGGNLRCFLKLVGTPWYPPINNHAFLIEMRGGDLARFSSYIAHHAILGTFEQAQAVIIGQLTDIDALGQRSEALRIVHEYARHIPVLEAPGLGHSPDSEATTLGMQALV